MVEVVEENGEVLLRELQGGEGVIKANLINTLFKERKCGVLETLLVQTIYSYMDPIWLRKLSMR